ncbi:MAG: rhodanese-like domain-containing protein, partial [Planctomycetota bacterium]|nr:rhodanese-like domain-containing protein [Planctomycetota bacterium]
PAWYIRFTRQLPKRNPMLPMQIDVESASRLLTEDESVLLLDVRELAEYETVHLPNSLLIPTSEFMEKIQQLKGKENQRILVICHHGVRSQGAATWMRANGFEQAQSISGGIDAWAVQLDPGLTRY